MVWQNENIRHIVEMGLTMLFHANLPLKLWVDAFLTVIHLINQLPSSSLGSDTPFHKPFKRHQDYRSLRVFGHRCFPSLRNYGVNKFSKKTYRTLCFHWI